MGGDRRDDECGESPKLGVNTKGSVEREGVERCVERTLLGGRKLDSVAPLIYIHLLDVLVPILKVAGFNAMSMELPAEASGTAISRTLWWRLLCIPYNVGVRAFDL